MTSRSSDRRKPVVLVPACNRMMGDHPFHMAGKKYLDAVRLAGCLPLIVPSAAPDELDALLDLADGLLLTGSKSNVHASHYGESTHDEALPQDRVRDDWVLPLIPKAIARGLPLLAICRGFQEANVALGGSLHQAVQEQPGLNDHRAAPGTPDEQYDFAHEVALQPGGLLADLLAAPRIQVNSLHGQGIKRLAPGLKIEALADDGLVEAFSVEAARGFALCVQWHPEWKADANPVSQRILAAFGAACRSYQGRDPET
ncbi:gamma-glutamyl-gamma-aminobutyrate hydrolase family protein [Roseateles sp. DAIF2]|uniref:gamma-glutamyl-gamma-aminobutyrate hydrolase family protein n=1 Tax=Roseateles sp. DAIF2 TaxID=2714952 RepID=UPI0018A2F6AF|nr:gamma-glutamyl-gamma-aminobutyrate hydrolase family protein [Roseateles sp. DAIF2]QPF74341.1 gamma-glutamyl-gamma-aminobutyrate hydrolase family protein [Roseateles sp. DAIF2]